MRRQLVLLALCAGCGNVNDTSPDGQMQPDAQVVPEALTGSLRTGCVLALHMDEAAGSGASGEVKDACGDDNPGTLVGQGNTVPNGAHGRAGSFSGNACVDAPNAEP